jgi:hypothetical protein
MILLIPQLEDEKLRELEYRNVKLSELAMSIRIGETPKSGVRTVVREAYSNHPVHAPVVMLKMGHFTDEFERIDWTMVRADMEGQEELEVNLPVEGDVLIEPEDLLIHLRGQHRVIRITEQMMDEMPNDLLGRGLKLAATNNFILMRPDQKTVYPPFLQIVMDILLEEVSREWAAVRNDQPSDNLLHDFLRWKYAESVGSTKSVGTPIGARELNRLSIDIPAEQWAQRAWAHRYNLLIYQEKLAMEKKHQFRSNLSQYINPNFKK